MWRYFIFAVVPVAFSQETIRVNTRLVQTAVIVRDKRGAVSDLTKGDFEIFDKGKSRRIATFAVTKASQAGQKNSLPPNTFSNWGNQQTALPVAATVLLFDRLNTSFTDQEAAREQVLALLKSIDPSGPVAIYALGNNLRILHDFTEDRAPLVRALERYRNGYSTLLTNSSTGPGVPPASPTSSTSPPAANPAIVNPDIPSEDWVAQILEPLRSYSLDRRAGMTLAAMQVIANRMAGVPGRKSLIWISGAFPLSLAFDKGGLTGTALRGVPYAADLQAAAEAIDRSNVAVYPVDARGLMISNVIRTEMPQPINQASTGVTYNVPTAEVMAGSREIETMKLLAEWTGGRAFYNNNDLRGAVRQAAEDAEVTYTLGFYAEEKELDGTYHELKVKVARKGADVRHRKGYFATAAAVTGSRPMAETLKNAVFSPADATGVGLTATLLPDAANAGSFVLTAGMDFHTLHLEAHNGRWANNVSFVVAQMAADGTVIDFIENTIRIDVTDENREKLLADGLAVKVAIRPAPGLSQIRVVMMDEGTGNLGSLRLVPPR